MHIHRLLVNRLTTTDTLRIGTRLDIQEALQVLLLNLTFSFTNNKQQLHPILNTYYTQIYSIAQFFIMDRAILSRQWLMWDWVNTRGQSLETKSQFMHVNTPQSNPNCW